MGKGLPRSLSRGPALLDELRKETIAINTTISVTGGAGSADFATAVLGDFPEGNVLFLGAVANLTFTGPTSANLADDWQGDFAIGTVPTADNSLGDAGEANMIASTAIPAATVEVSSVRGAGATTAIFDNTDGSLEINLNVLLDDGEVGNTETVEITVTGELYVAYTMLGDD
jgi:hypothetical protein